MKTIQLMVTAGFFLVAAAGPCDAKQKLWKWKPARVPFTYVLQASVMGSDGSASFVFGQAPHHSGKPRYLLVWVDSGGRVVLSKKLKTDDQVEDVLTVDADWSLKMIGRKLVVSNGQTTKVYRARGTKQQPGKRVKGYLEVKTSPGLEIDRFGRTVDFDSVQFIKAWKL